MTTQAPDQAAALVALLRAKLPERSWSDIASEALFTGDVHEVWLNYSLGSGLIADPRMTALLDEARASVSEWADAGLRMITVLDDHYPARLREIRETPPFLFADGMLIEDDRGMSVVGSRRASEHGNKVARMAAQLLVDKGLTVIAGLAAGIDTVAHRTALELGGRTVAFIGTGITKFYPAENRGLQQQIAQRGLVLSQFWPDASPTRHSFPIRNAAMSGYGMATIVVEAGETSGTRIQARLAVEHGRPVILTDAVAERTKWGAALVGRPGVHVVSSTSELDATISLVVQSESGPERALGKALSSLGGSAHFAA